MTIRRRFLMLITIAAVLAAGCAGTPEAPPASAPAQARTEAYPASRYLVATGYGSDPAGARRDARGAMAAIFSSTVYAETMAQATSVFGIDGEEQFEKQVANSVRVISNVALDGVDVVDRGQDADTGAYTALAVLDRRQAAARWQRELDRLADGLAAEMAALPAVAGDLSRLAALNRIAGLAIRQEAVASRLRVVGGATAMSGGEDFRDVAAELAALRQRVTIAIVLEGDGADSAAETMRAVMSREGVLLTDDAASAAGRVAGRLVIQPLEIDNPRARFVRAVISAELVDAHTGVAMKSVRTRVRKAHADEREATRMAVRAAAEQAAAEIAAALGRIGGGGE